MKRIPLILGRRPGRAAWAFTLAAATLAAADPRIRYEPKPGSTVTIDGTSSVHDWRVAGNVIRGFLEVDPAFETTPPPRDLTATPRVAVEIPVRSLKSQVAVGASVMDRVMYAHLKQDEKDASGRPRWPDITFALLDLTRDADVPASPRASAYHARGVLSVCGVSRTNSLLVTIERGSPDRLKVQGNATLRMSDFGIARPAPTIGVGAIKTGDEVKITFTWVLGRQTRSGASP